MRLQKIEPAPEAAQHAEREHIDLHESERVDVVLVPFDEGALVHGGVADRHRLVEPLAREHEAADVLGEVTRKADELVGRARPPAGSPGLRGSSPAWRMWLSGRPSP